MKEHLVLLFQNNDCNHHKHQIQYHRYLGYAERYEEQP